MNNTTYNRVVTDRTEYNGDIYGTNNVVFFKLGLTVEEVRKAMEENKKLTSILIKYNDALEVIEAFKRETKELKEKIVKAKEALA